MFMSEGQSSTLSGANPPFPKKSKRNQPGMSKMRIGQPQPQPQHNQPVKNDHNHNHNHNLTKSHTPTTTSTQFFYDKTPQPQPQPNFFSRKTPQSNHNTILLPKSPKFVVLPQFYHKIGVKIGVITRKKLPQPNHNQFF